MTGASIETTLEEHALDDVALFVDCSVVIVLDLAVFARRNDRLGASLDQLFAQCLAVVPFVSHKLGRRRHCFDAEPCNLAIMHVSGRQEQDAGAALLVVDRVELVFRPPFVRPMP